MPFPFLSGYLAITKPDGECVELFNGCRTFENFDDNRGLYGGWKKAPAERMWDGCCCWAWPDSSGTDDPWFDEAIPASSEVAGGFIMPPDLNGHGFYLEPSSTERILSEGGPLEMFLTFAVISCTARGERHFLNWLNCQLRDACNPCGKLELTVGTECPCDDETFDDSVDGYPAPVFDAAGRVGGWCDGETPASEGGNVASDPGIRQILSARFTGFEPLDETLSFCNGNTYKLNFEVDCYDWLTAASTVCVLESSGCDSDCAETGLFELCGDDIVNPCEPNGDDRAAYETVSSFGSRSNSTAGGAICLDGRWSRPSRVGLDACLVDFLPGSSEAVVGATIMNSGAVVNDVRIVVWEHIEGTPPPNTAAGFKIYNSFTPTYEARFAELPANETITLSRDGKALWCCGGVERSLGGFETAGFNGLGCGRRWWIGLETPCGADSVKAEVNMSYREQI